MSARPNIMRWIMSAGLLLPLCVVSYGQGSSMTLETAIATLRGIDFEKFPENQREAKAKQIDEAWKFLVASGPAASVRLKQEIEKVDRQKEKDDFFKLNAAVVLWNIGKSGEAEYIARVWETTPVQHQYNYVFYTAFDAAGTQDPKVLPMLRAILKDDKGAIFISLHAMNVRWPLSHEFIWGSYGHQGLPVLADIVEKSNNEVELKSAIVLLARNQYLPALPRIRQLAASTNDEVRRQAVQALGVYGHPSDYDRLIAGLKSTDTKDLFAHAFALYEFEDERAVPNLVPLLARDDDALRVEASLALLHLFTPESLKAVNHLVATTSNPELKTFLGERVAIRETDLPKDYALKPRAQQAELFAKLKNKELAVTSIPLTNQQLLEALKIWKEKGRIYKSGFDWVGVGRVISAAKPENLDELVSTKAAFYRRLSDECLYEVRDLETAMKYIGRSRYRLGMGITEKAEPR